MRKSIFFLSLFLFLFPVSIVLGETWADFSYRFRGDGVEITAYFGDAEELVIPRTIVDRNVIGISPRAFEGNAYIKSIVMPDVILSIGRRAFADCGNLSSIHFSAGLIAIGDEAFRNCKSLVTIQLPVALERIGRGVFSGCENLQFIQELNPVSIKHVGSGAFDDTAWFRNSNDKLVTLRQGSLLLKYRGDDSVVELPWNIVFIAEGAFEGNNTITDLHLPNYLKGLQKGAISGIANLKSVQCLGKPEFIEEFAFQNLPALDTVLIESPLLNSNSFLNCPVSPFGDESSSGWDPEIPDEADRMFLTEYDDNLGGVVILHCLRDAEIPEGKLVIPDFIRNKRVVSIGSGACQNREDIRKIVLPEFLKFINSWAFSYDTALSEVVFPDQLERIDADAFTNSSISENEIDFPVRTEIDPRAFLQVK